VTLSDGTAELVEERTTTSNTISFTDLDNDTEYEMTVLAINNAGSGPAMTVTVTTLTPSGWYMYSYAELVERTTTSNTISFTDLGNY